MWREKYEQIFILLLAAIQFEKHHLLKMPSFLQCVFFASLWKKNTVFLDG